MNMLNQERLKEVEAKPLFTGAGNNIDHACIMQMVSYVAGEKWTDHPECACPVLTRYAIALNDRFNDEHRQLLKPFIAKLVGTRATDAEKIARKRMMMWRNVTATYPLILEAIKMPKLAAKLRKLENTPEGMAKASSLLKARKEKIKKYANANANAYADAYANAYADAYANAYANAYAYADANAYAYAKALRDKLAEVAIETLRLAIEVRA
jgi:hypothetical protein